MAKILVKKSNPLVGSVKIDGAKNAVLPIIAATLLAEGKSVLRGVPNLKDVHVISDLLRHLGAKVEYKDCVLTVDASEIKTCEAPYELVRKMRASFLVMGPLLARFKHTKISMPGGCAIGTRPIDLHLKGFKALGSNVIIDHGFVEANADKLVGGKLYLDFPSVGATENIMMAASLSEGTTIIENAAEEPEIVDLANFLNEMGANVKGAGTNTIRIKGVKSLKGAEHNVIPDRIEAATYMVAAAMTKGDITVENVMMEHLKPVVAKLKEAGCEIIDMENSVRVKGPEVLKPIDIKTLPHPGFPTDVQAQFMAMATIANGTGVVIETVFENRFMHVAEFNRMGANIKIEGRSAIVTGVDKLYGSSVKATDLRAGAALILCGLIAEGETEIGDIYHIQRGYVDIDKKIQALGGNIEIIED
ncbi:UDP-N-acetylglucosamine 1-carboxyvinyltransferase [Paraclostridium sordellii]|uniref:UDP-N-acetylglucosamine 1-carboxyvinyltransferase n=1 Tax=Paraclostridium sordellii TaxID=1505 RepID=A0A0C7QXK5_PARSO|nr:UDP-N-acetylglucosamine 1-carboxyvinyltransferase [Paeniclostridium sordellii]QYE97915.1 UDP-N-acetylglucosamine 1-carboxyvinyltransferase [Paeniclostridium sordellii]CEN80381.1 UDP-N-acetylglucosamine 1-carboxyvinyltransferase [[Clostridium] sordellii] [Paeniclostridium sordellii]CEO14536.1 UDP-N-acetylglucosamine 1-carboxyvinyltransferase [[Clostridium] sordellii] [Paeniclostridium sordellii]CEP89704.1 UDP-N-acetylglucosamine 1-carboxyvinyltransferase [[Clostridium] sordellii] [Paeniclostr